MVLGPDTSYLTALNRKLAGQDGRAMIVWVPSSLGHIMMSA